jgi:hypothetical protein
MLEISAVLIRPHLAFVPTKASLGGLVLVVDDGPRQQELLGKVLDITSTRAVQQ